MSDVVVVGSFNQDLAFSTVRFPAPGETLIGTFRSGPGGKGFNQAIATRKLGVDTLFIGALGHDVFAASARSFAEKQSLRCSFESVATEATGAASIVINDQAENQIVVAPGANNRLSVAHVEQNAREVASCKVLLSQLESNLDATAHALSLARTAGATTMLNPAPINVGISRNILQHVDILVPNETEFAFLCKQLFGRELTDDYWTQSEQVLHALCRETGVPTVIITLGAKGCFVSHGPGAKRHHSSLPFYGVDAAEVCPVDTTGAGDAFNGALAAGIVRFGVTRLNMACRYASQVAGLSTETRGAAVSMPDEDTRARRFGA